MEIWSVNTNKKELGSLGSELVINQNRIILWHRKGKPSLSKISKGDLILSYNKKKTIVAVGYAVSERVSYDNSPSWVNVSKEEWVNVDWICTCISNPIKLDDIVSNKITMFSGSIFKWTHNIDTFKLLTEIGKRKI